MSAPGHVVVAASPWRSTRRARLWTWTCWACRDLPGHSRSVHEHATGEAVQHLHEAHSGRGALVLHDAPSLVVYDPGRVDMSSAQRARRAA